MTICPSGLGAVPTGYSTADVDLTARSHLRSFRCLCGKIHSWTEGAAWSEPGFSAGARRAYGLDPGGG